MQLQAVTVGNPDGFAIHLSLTDGPPGRRYGHLSFTVREHTIGNPHDFADMTGVRGWFGGYLTQPPTGGDLAMFSVDAPTFFETYYDGPSALSGQPCAHDLTDRRFSITELGMSAFDPFDVLVLTRPEGGERLLWRGADCPPMAHDLPPGAFRATLRAAYEWMCQAF